MAFRSPSSARHEAVLVLDAEDMIVACESERR